MVSVEEPVVMIGGLLILWSYFRRFESRIFFYANTYVHVYIYIFVYNVLVNIETNLMIYNNMIFKFLNGYQ